MYCEISSQLPPVATIVAFSPISFSHSDRSPSTIQAVPRITPDRIASRVLSPIAVLDIVASSFGSFDVHLLSEVS